MHTLASEIYIFTFTVNAFILFQIKKLYFGIFYPLKCKMFKNVEKRR